MNLFIKNLSMKGFSKHKQEVVYEFKSNNQILGENEEGKSTIGNAIAWGFLNSDLNGVEKSISYLKNLSSKYTVVKINYSIDDKEYELIRRSGYSNNNGLFVNGDKTTTEKLLAEQFNCDKDLFLCLINPNYFMTFTPKKSREFLNKYLKKISKSEIMKEFSDYEIELLTKEDFNFYNPNISLSEKRNDITEAEKALIYTDGMIDSMDLSTIDNTNDKLKDNIKIKDEISKLKISIENTLSLNTNNSDEEEKKKLEIELAKIQSEKFVDEDQHKLNDLINQYNLLRSEYKNIPIEKPTLQDVNILQKNVVNFKQQYKELATKINKINATKTQCPQCGNIFVSNKEILDELLNSLETIKQNGINANKDLENAKVNNKKLLEEYNTKINEYKQLKGNEGKQCSNKIKTLQQIVVEKERNFENLKKEKISKIKNQILLLNTKITAKQKTKEEQISKQKNDLTKLEEKLNQINQYNNNIINKQNLAKENKDKITKLKKKKEDTVNRISTLKLAIDIIKRYISTKVKLQSDFIQKHLNKTEIIFEKISKSSGEIKDVFEITYEGKPINMLSASTKIRTGLEIRNMLAAISDLNLPIIIDNAESITHFDKPNCQLFQLIVKKDATLSVVSSND